MNRIARNFSIFWLMLWFGSAALLSVFCASPAFELSRALAPPVGMHLPAGADTYGRELLQLTARASLLSLGFAVFCVGVSVLLALLIAGGGMTFPKRLQQLLNSTLHFFLSFPSMLFALAVAGLLGPGRSTVALSIILGSAPGLARTLWVRAREIASMEFIWAARSLGAGPWRLIVKHYMPHLISLARVKMPSLLANALLAEASLSFLGLGFPVGEESWGSLLAQGKDYLIEAPHISLAVGLPLILSLLALDVISKPHSRGLR